MELIRKFSTKILKILINPRLSITPTTHSVKKLGSVYGGWSFVTTDDLKGCCIVSAGLGEDASFDVEIAGEYGLKVILVDPTPKAIAHFSEIESSYSIHKTSPYAQDGKQKISSYELGSLNAENFELIPKALWTHDKNINFYAPSDPTHVSYSILNYQNRYSTQTAYIEVESITLSQILSSKDLDAIPLIKLDIEGAAIEVVQDFLDKGIFPKQILLEFDELTRPSIRGRKRILACHRKLLSMGYELIHRDYPANFLYFKKS